MASTQLQRLIFLILLAIADAGRPCKTIIFISTTTTSIENPNFQNPTHHLTLYLTNTRPVNPDYFLSYKSNALFAHRRSLNPPHTSSLDNSIRDTTLDIMTIVGALLFGLGSGALTAAIMYFIWSMFDPRAVDSEDDAQADQFIFSPKKMGYVALPVDNGAKQAVRRWKLEIFSLGVFPLKASPIGVQRRVPTSMWHGPFGCLPIIVARLSREVGNGKITILVKVMLLLEMLLVSGLSLLYSTLFITTFGNKFDDGAKQVN